MVFKNGVKNIQAAALMVRIWQLCINTLISLRNEGSCLGMARGIPRPSILEVPDLFSLFDSPRNRFYHSSNPRGPRQISRGPRKFAALVFILNLRPLLSIQPEQFFSICGSLVTKVRSRFIQQMTSTFPYYFTFQPFCFSGSLFFCISGFDFTKIRQKSVTQN